ncbi:hypothetical protein NA78x_002699 [Anatilimnocola sp. NA78]|uniref:hypothetical protein n=1 Tax=Anatilimnocola sp. NA78 TaxID=3415683 RepID=UPI003CE57C23
MTIPHSRGDASSKRCLVHLGGWGYARFSLAEITGLRRKIPAWAVTGTPGHFFKYADEQTILAVQALDHLLERQGDDLGDRSRFAVIAAPQFLGRISSVNTFSRFQRSGAPSVSPHIIPQHSLHSVSGAISVLLGCRGPNVGVGGGPGALDNALLSATTLFAGSETTSAWLVCTGWDPEPQFDREGNCLNEPICQAFALAVSAQPMPKQLGALQLHLPDRGKASVAATSSALTVAQIVAELQAVESRQAPASIGWQTNWGATVELKIVPHVIARLQAA